MTRPSPPSSWKTEEALAKTCLAALDLVGAAHHGRRALALADPRDSLWLRYRYLEDYEGVIDQGASQLAAAPADAGLLLILARAHAMVGRRDEAFALFARLAEHHPTRPDVIYALAEGLILLGDTVAGWRRFDSLVDDALVQTIDPRAKADLARFWRGQPLAGKRILVVNYLGIGDNLMMFRYVRDLKARGAFVAFACRPELYRLLKGSSGPDQLWPDLYQAPWSDFDYWTFDYLAPRWLGAPEDQVPAYQGGYVTRPPPRGPSRRPGRLRVGLCATTGVDHFTNTARFLSPEALRPLAKLSHIDWVWAQTAPVHPQFAARSGLAPAPGPQPAMDFYDAAQLLTGLDLLVSICSAPLHLAGALGLPALGLICAAPDWRWGPTGAACRWYPNLTLFRQQKVGDWTGVVAGVREALAAYSPSGAGAK